MQALKTLALGLVEQSGEQLRNVQRDSLIHSMEGLTVYATTSESSFTTTRSTDAQAVKGHEEPQGAR